MLRNWTKDDALLDVKASAAVVASAAGTVIVDFGDGLVEGNIIIDVTVIDVATTDELYTIILQLSPDALFGTAANIMDSYAITLGAAAARLTDCDKGSVVGRYVLPFTNEVCGTIYRYGRIYTLLNTTGESITYAARMVRR